MVCTVPSASATLWKWAVWFEVPRFSLEHFLSLGSLPPQGQSENRDSLFKISKNWNSVYSAELCTQFTCLMSKPDSCTWGWSKCSWLRWLWQAALDDALWVLRFLIEFCSMAFNDYLNYLHAAFLALQGSLFPIHFWIFFGHTVEAVNKTAFFNGFIGIRISNCSHFSLYITGSFCGIWLANVDIVLFFPAFVGNNGLKSILWVFILPKSILVSHMPINQIFLSIIRAPADD